MRGQLSAGTDRNPHFHLIHVEFAQLAHDFALQLLGSLAALLGEFSGDALGLREHAAVLLPQFFPAVVRVLERIQFDGYLLKVREDFRNRTAVFLLQTVDFIQALLDHLALCRRKVQIVPLTCHAVAQVCRQQTYFLGLLGHAVEGVRHFAQALDGACRLIEQLTRARNFVISRERHTRLLECARNLARVIEIRLALCKHLIFIGFKCRLLDFLLVEGQHIDALQAFLLAGLQRSNFPP